MENGWFSMAYIHVMFTMFALPGNPGSSRLFWESQVIETHPIYNASHVEDGKTL